MDLRAREVAKLLNVSEPTVYRWVRERELPAHRIGQQRTVQVHKYVCIGTMEERIDRMITEKTQLADRIITSGDEWLTGLSTDDLRKTLELSADAVEDFNGGNGG
jgi:excisionase family DNA binding protein